MRHDLSCGSHELMVVVADSLPPGTHNLNKSVPPFLLETECLRLVMLRGEGAAVLETLRRTTNRGGGLLISRAEVRKNLNNASAANKYMTAFYLGGENIEVKPF